MGREVRRVPADWDHPKNERGNYKPLLGRSYETTLADWLEGRAKWAEGVREDWSASDDGPKQWKTIEPEHAEQAWEEWDGDAPQFSDFMPNWPEEERTHLQMYEDTSEGTPISPVMETPEELARWLADNNASAFGSDTATYESWLATIKRGWAISAVFEPGKGLRSGVTALAEGE